MVALPKPLIVTPAPSLLTRLRIVGAAVKTNQGKITITNASRVPPHLMAEVQVRRDDLIAELTSETANDGSITALCSRCGAPSGPFLAIINPDLWQCDACLPADPNDQAFEAIERQAIIAEGRPDEPVLIAMPVSWADSSLIPTAGARCRNCNGATWWTEAVQPNGWRCSACHPGRHLSADRRRDVTT
jgi:hypothetical protein